MHRYRFAARPLWMLGHLLVVAAVVAMLNLGFWQLRRLEERKAANELVETRGRVAPVALDTLAARPTRDIEFRRATATGAFDPAHEVLVGYRSSQGLPGFHVVTPLVLDDGSAVLVNRGFVPLDMANRWPVAEARAPAGEVTVTGVLRRGKRAPAATASQQPLRLKDVDIAQIRRVVPNRLLPVHLELQLPRPDGFPDPLPPLDLGDGPHLSYAIQWFAFTTLAVVGWPIVLRRRVRQHTVVARK